MKIPPWRKPRTPAAPLACAPTVQTLDAKCRDIAEGLVDMAVHLRDQYRARIYQGGTLSEFTPRDFIALSRVGVILSRLVSNQTTESHEVRADLSRLSLTDLETLDRILSK